MGQVGAKVMHALGGAGSAASASPQPKGENDMVDLEAGMAVVPKGT